MVMARACQRAPGTDIDWKNKAIEVGKTGATGYPLWEIAKQVHIQLIW